MRTKAKASALFLLACVAPSLPAGEEPGLRPAWLDRVQTYSMLPVTPATAAQMHVSVNGAWAGIDSDHPILPTTPSVRRKYGADVNAFVTDCRRAGLVVCGVVNGIEGMKGLRKRFPNLDEMACRNADGKPASNAEWPLMCTNNPDWIAAEVELGKAAIDAGAELLLVDTPMGSAFLSSGFLKAGFCRHCLTNFERHLARTYTARELRDRLGVERFDANAVTARLRPFQDFARKKQPFENDSPDDRLFREFILCQERASFDTRKLLIDRLRAYARGKKQPVAFCTNAADLGTMNAFGHWVRGIMFADLVDFFAYEQEVLPTGLPPDRLLPLPRGKWAAYHKLAYAIHGRRSPAVLHAGTMGKFLVDVMIKQKNPTSAWFGALAAEAYAANGAFILFHVEAPLGSTVGLQKFWARGIEVNGFVRAHPDLYEGGLRSGSPLAVLFLFNERGRTVPSVCPSYLGFAQALVEGNYPFDTVFGGDGRYVRDRLQLESLKRYAALIVPSPIDPTDNQKRVLQQFVREGGTLVAQELKGLGIDVELRPDRRSYLGGTAAYGKGRVYQLAGKPTPTWTDDVGANYFKTYEPGLREQVHDLARALGATAVVDASRHGQVSAFPVVQPEQRRVVVHLVNYDIDLAADAVREEESVTVRLPRSVLPRGRLRAEVSAPGATKPQPLPIVTSADAVSCTIPKLGSAASLVVRAD
jgi:hypothetical protein